jgi:uncharacterized membrane protein HdeD (DUF308 family)
MSTRDRQMPLWPGVLFLLLGIMDLIVAMSQQPVSYFRLVLGMLLLIAGGIHIRKYLKQ